MSVLSSVVFLLLDGMREELRDQRLVVYGVRLIPVSSHFYVRR